jgi:hypothetical protein
MPDAATPRGKITHPNHQLFFLLLFDVGDDKKGVLLLTASVDHNDGAVISFGQPVRNREKKSEGRHFWGQKSKGRHR